MLSLLHGFEKDSVVLDYDHTLIFNEKADAQRTNRKENGYGPGVGTTGKHIVYVENSYGRSNAPILQHETIERMCSLLHEAGVTIDIIRTDSASFKTLFYQGQNDKCFRKGHYQNQGMERGKSRR